jgi:3-hydroxyisobutyrate dehydrogenase
MAAADRPLVGIVGLGRMGAPIAGRLRETGTSVTATDLRPERRALAESLGIGWAPGTAQLAAECGVVVTVLPGPGEVREVIPPLLRGLEAGDAWIDMTSGVPELAHEIRRRVRPGVRVLECPVGGGPDEAGRGELLGFIGGDAADRAAGEWLLRSLCRGFAHAGAPGTGYAAKLLVNLLWFGQALAVSEALALGARLGLDPARLRTTLAESAAGSRFLDRDAPRLLSGDDMATFALSRCVEELEGVLGLAGEQDLELPMAERVTELYRQALRTHGDADGELLAARRLAEHLGVVFSRLQPAER